MAVCNEAINRPRQESEGHTQLIDDTTASDAAERLIMTEKLIRELNETWEEKIRKSDEIRRQRYERSLPPPTDRHIRALLLSSMTQLSLLASCLVLGPDSFRCKSFEK